MATIHPSRMGLIPPEMRTNSSDKNRRRSPSPRRRRSPSPRRSRSRERDGDRDKDRERRRDGGRGRDSGYDGDRRYGRGDSRERGRDSYRDDRRDGPTEPRRSSPQYEDYKRPPPPTGSGEPSVPWRKQDSMYPPKQNFHHQGGGSSNFLEARRTQRAEKTVDIWPPSPKAPARELSPKGKKSSRKSKRHRSPTPSDTDSEEEERRRERKERRRARKAREKEERREKKKHRRHRSRYSSDEDSDDDDDKHHKHRSKRTRSRSISRSRSKSKSVRDLSRTPDANRMEIDVVSKTSPKIPFDAPIAFSHSHSHHPPNKTSPKSEGDSDSGDDIGPQPAYKKGGNKKVDERAYGGALLRGEGSAMAAFLQDGTETRIPRRGEIGLTSDEIAKYEDVGYVMSGSRHRRMNAVRMRKENQVISAEEKRGILKLQREERERKEAILRDEFNQLVTEKLKAV